MSLEYGYKEHIVKSHKFYSWWIVNLKENSRSEKCERVLVFGKQHLPLSLRTWQRLVLEKVMTNLAGSGEIEHASD